MPSKAKPSKPNPFAAANAARARKRQERLAVDEAPLSAELAETEAEFRGNRQSVRAAARAAARREQEESDQIAQESRIRAITRVKAKDAPTSRSLMGGSPRQDPRQRQRQPMRSPDGRAQAIGRDGKILMRTRTNTGDRFHINPEEIPEGWSYNWKAVTVIGVGQKELVREMTAYEANGWTPVPASRHPCRFMPAGYEGNIVDEGLMLMERPQVLTDEANAEDLAAARNLLKTQNEQFQPRLPGARAGQRGTAFQARRTIEGMPPDVPTPNYEMAVDDGLV